jgi:hypothetical protein
VTMMMMVVVVVADAKLEVKVNFTSPRRQVPGLHLAQVTSFVPSGPGPLLSRSVP